MQPTTVGIEKGMLIMMNLFERLNRSNEELGNLIAMNIITSRIIKGLRPDNIEEVQTDIDTINIGESIAKKYVCTDGEVCELVVSKDNDIVTVTRVGEVEFAMDHDGVKSFKETISRLI